MSIIQNWFRRNSSDPQVVLLVLVVVFLVGIIWWVGDSLAPVLAAVIFAYLLQGAVNRLERRGMPHLGSVMLVFLGFILAAAFVLLALLPLLVRQISDLATRLPAIARKVQDLLLRLPESYPSLISEDQVRNVMERLSQEALGGTQWLLSYSLTSVVAAMTLLVYLILVPFLVFFLLKDRAVILGWLTSFLPAERPLADRVWNEINHQLAGYVRGKFWEIAIVAAVSWAVFVALGLEYAALLGAVTGLSVLIPYIGAAVITLPVAAVGYFQWGLSLDFAWVVLAYAVIQALDGNVLAPLLLGGAVNVHPVAVIIAILFFGGIWGFWGVFFAIPLAGVVHAIIESWPRESESPEPVIESDGEEG